MSLILNPQKLKHPSLVIGYSGIPLDDIESTFQTLFKWIISIQ